MADGSKSSRRVCVAYPFFPHYRGPVLSELLSHGHHRYTLVADPLSSEPSIKVWPAPDELEESGGWVTARVWRLGRRHGAYIQPGLVWAGLSRRYDVLVIHSGVWWPTTWLCALAGRLTGKDVISWGHGWTRPEQGWRGALRRAYYRLYHRHMTYGHLAKHLFMQTGWSPDRVQVIYNSLDYAKQRAERERVLPIDLRRTREEVMGPGETPVVLCITRLITLRRLEELIRAAARLKQTGRPVRLLIVGEGPERVNLMRQASAREIDCVFYGACYDEGVLARLVMLSSVLVSPGPIGLAAVHAMAYGTPVVTHDDLYEHGPEVEAVVPGRTGGLFVKGNIESLAEQVWAWASLSGEAREVVRSACVKVVERFWNAPAQRRCIERCIDGLPADDLCLTTGPESQEPATGKNSREER